MKFERSELGALFSKLRTAVPEVRAVGTDDAGILLSGSNAYATKSRECPFCGAPTYEVVSVTGMKCVRCTNKKNCGAIVSFNNKDCDERGVSPAVYFNRRAGKE